MTYDTRGRFPATLKNGLGHTETHTYYPETGARKSVKDANGLEAVWQVDGFGRTAKELRDDGNESRFYLKACQGDCPGGAVAAQIIDTVHGSDRITVPQVQYIDSAGHVLRSLTWGLDGRAIVVDQRYDSRGRVFERDRPRFENEGAYLDSRNVYDNLDRVTSTERFEAGTTNTTTTAYRGFRRESTNARGFRRIEQRNVIGQVKKVTDPNNKVASFEYEPFGGLSKTTDPNGNVILVEYDLLGRKTHLHDSDLGHIAYTIDPLGRVISQMSPKQRVRYTANNSPAELTRTEYDDLDRMTARYEPDLNSYWVYDTASNGIGKLAEAYTLAGAIKDYQRLQEYDALGRPSQTTQKLANESYKATLGYDAWGRPITQSYQRNADGIKRFDTRYRNGYLAQVERGSLVLWKVSAQDASLRPTSVALGNGLTQAWTYDPNGDQLKTGMLTTAAGAARLQEGYDYDAIGSVVRRLQYWDQGGFQEDFTYDVLNRVETSTVLGQAQQTFRYDAAGNLLSKTGVGTGDYVYPKQGATAVRPHAVKSIPGLGAFTYDDNGNLKQGAGRTTTWTSFDMPLKITGTGASAQFVYGPEHQRTRQSRSDGTSVIYAGAQEVERSAGGVTVKTYWPLGIGVEIDRPNSATELNWLHNDRLGSVMGITDGQGVLKEELAYDAWGKRRTMDGAPVDGTATPNSIDGKVDNRGFTGHEMLDQLDLVHMNGRVYDPFVARFMSGDPLIQSPTNGQSYNRYSAVVK